MVLVLIAVIATVAVVLINRDPETPPQSATEGVAYQTQAETFRMTVCSGYMTFEFVQQ